LEEARLIHVKKSLPDGNPEKLPKPLIGTTPAEFVHFFSCEL
jgi:hypothetical protein